jgi:hypothetical protein
MVSKQMLDQLNIILQEDYKLNLTAYDLSNLANSLVGYFECLKEINEENK